MLTAAAMVRHWLRELAAVLRSQPMGNDIPILLEQTLQMVGTNRANDANQDNGTVGGPGPCKKRRVLNTLELARMRLEYLCDEDGENGLCQHAGRTSRKRSRTSGRGKKCSNMSPATKGVTKWLKGDMASPKPSPRPRRPLQLQCRETWTGSLRAGARCS